MVGHFSRSVSWRYFVLKGVFFNRLTKNCAIPVLEKKSGEMLRLRLILRDSLTEYLI